MNLQARPTGIGQIGDNGCVCHGASSDTAVVTLEGLPEVWEGNTTYQLFINLSGPDEGSAEEAKGGFRLLVSEGNMSGNDSLMHMLEEGMTHTLDGNKYRAWTVEWTTPQDDTSTAHFRLHSNAVNGDGFTSGDMWTSYEVSIAGANASTITAPPSGPSAFEIGAFAVIGIGLVGMLYLLVSKSEDET